MHNMAVAVSLIIIAVALIIILYGGRLAFGKNPFTTASKGRETVMIEKGELGLSMNARDGIKVGGGTSWLLVFATDYL